MINLFLFLFSGLFFLKLIWNVLIPFELVKNYLQEKHSAITLMPFVEILLFFLIVILSLFYKGNGYFGSTKRVLLHGTGLIVLSYSLLFLLGIMIGWFVEKYKSKKQDKPD